MGQAASRKWEEETYGWKAESVPQILPKKIRVDAKFDEPSTFASTLKRYLF